MAAFDLPQTEPAPRPRVRYPLLADRQWLRNRYEHDRADLEDIAEQAGGCHTSTVRWWLRRHNIPLRPPAPTLDPRLSDREWLHRRYVTEGATQREIADEVGAEQSSVSKALRAAGIQARPSHPRPAHPLLADREWLHQRYVIERKTQAAIARELDVTPSAVRVGLARVGIESDGPRPARREDPRLHDRDWLVANYLETSATLLDVAAELGVGRQRVVSALEAVGLSTKPRGWHTAADPRLEDAEWLREARLADRRSLLDIADELDATPNAVVDALRVHGIGDRWDRRRDDHPKLNDSEWLTCRYEQVGHLTAIADELGVTVAAVRDRLAAADIRLSHGARGVLDRETLTRLYVIEQKSQRQVADEVGCSESAVSLAMKKWDIPKRPRRQPRHPKLDDAAWLRRVYVEQGRTISQISELLGVSEQSVSDALRRHDIDRRNHVKAQTHPVLDERDALAAMYATMTQLRIAQVLGVAEKRVRAALRAHGIGVNLKRRPFR